MTRRARRLTIIGSALGVLALAVGLVLFALRDNIVFFYSPAEIEARHVVPGTRLRMAASSNRARSNASRDAPSLLW